MEQPEEQDAMPQSSPVELFQGQISPRRVSVVYQTGLGAVALAMLLLPALYFGLIALVGYGIYWHMAHDLSWLQGSSVYNGPSIGGILIYFAPVVAGAILIFFMFKPFLARQHQVFLPMDISRNQHPMLFALIEEICRQINAPIPKRVDVNCDVNASASFRRGFLSLFGHDVVLTIGLPLAAGLDMQQFAGVLAHEFGHFAQGTAMRLTYVIRRINGWFARVVYQRDQWDVWLHAASRQRDVRVSAVFMVARLGVWLSRLILWLFMYLGHGISCFMLRQMEYDADSYEIQLAGSEAFISTARQLRILNVAAQQAYGELGEGWKRRRVPDSLPVFIVAKAETIPAETRTKIEEAVARTVTKAFDTHPSDTDRVRQAERMGAAGVFQATEPATTLFHNFDELARSVSLMHYQQGLRLPLAPEHLIPVEETARESHGQTQGMEALKRFLLGQVTDLRPLVITEHDLAPAPDPGAAMANLAAARHRMQQSRAEVESVLKQYHEADKKVIQAGRATQLLTVGCKIKAEDFQLPEASLEAAKRAGREGENSQRECGLRLEAFEADARLRLASALQLLHAPEVAEGIENLEQLKAEAMKLAAVLPKLATAYPQLLELRRQFIGLQTLFAYREKCSAKERLDYRVTKLAQEAQQCIQEIQAKLAHVRYPFSHAKTELSLADFAMPDRSNDHPVLRSYQQAESHLSRLFGLNSQILGQLALIAERVEGRFDFGDTEAKTPAS